MPGSPPTRIVEPGTRPPPHTRSSSAMPVSRRGGPALSPRSATKSRPRERAASGLGAEAFRRRGARHFLDQAVPGAAGLAPPGPARRDRAALLAGKAGLGFRHARAVEPSQSRRRRPGPHGSAPAPFGASRLCAGAASHAVAIMPRGPASGSALRRGRARTGRQRGCRNGRSRRPGPARRCGPDAASRCGRRSCARWSCRG